MNLISNAVELTVMDKEFNRIKVIKAFSSLQWIERYYGYGEFELHCDRRFLGALFNGAYISRKDSGYVGIIEYRKVTGQGSGVMVKGRFLEAIFAKRVIETAALFTGTAEEVCRQIVAYTCLNGERKIDKLELGEVAGIGGKVAVSRQGKTVSDTLFEILAVEESSFKVTYDISANAMCFAVYKGLDRTDGQNQNDWCVFSSAFYNILDEKYENNEDNRNFAYVVGQDSAGNLVSRTVSLDINMPRSEIYVDARDIRAGEMTAEEFTQALKDRGLSRLSEYNVSDCVEIEVDTNKAMKFDLGDKCSYTHPELGLKVEGRVSEIYETFEAGAINRRVVLGKEDLTIVQKLKRLN